MEKNPKPRRRWYRFSLRTMLVLVSLVCVTCGYVGWALNWKRQRHVFLESHPKCLYSVPSQDWPAPWPLRLFGEVGIIHIQMQLVPGRKEELKELKARTEEVKRLFPESKVQSFLEDKWYEDEYSSATKD